MTTPRTRSLVSLAAVLTAALALGGCVSAPSRLVLDAPAPAGDAPPAGVRFDNDARDYVHVYLVGQRREWLLGRVEPGARATLRIPEEALAEDAGSMRLVALAGARVTQRPASEARAVITLEQPAAAILSQRWTFSQTTPTGQLTPLPLARGRVEGGPQ
jgi:hypothetical protein